MKTRTLALIAVAAFVSATAAVVGAPAIESSASASEPFWREPVMALEVCVDTPIEPPPCALDAPANPDAIF